MPLILALDIATSCGWATSVGQSGVWDLSVKKDESNDMRLFRFRSHLEYTHRDIGVELVAYEQVMFKGPNAQRAMIVQSELQGVLKLWCKDNGISFKPYTSSAIKKHLTGMGKASKEEMINAAMKRWKKPITSDDEADALGLLSLAMEEFKE